MQVSEIMHEGVRTVQINDPIKRVASLMKREDIGAVPVYKNLRPVGFVTDRDIVVSCVANGKSPDEPIATAMNKDIVYVYDTQDISEAVKLMKDNQISRLLVVDQGQQPVGMLTLQDIAENTYNQNLKAEVLTEIKRG